MSEEEYEEISITLTNHQWYVLEMLAKKNKMSLNDFVVQVITTAAEEDIRAAAEKAKKDADK